jgi:hypothetical protein
LAKNTFNRKIFSLGGTMEWFEWNGFQLLLALKGQNILAQGAAL